MHVIFEDTRDTDLEVSDLGSYGLALGQTLPEIFFNPDKF